MIAKKFKSARSKNKCMQMEKKWVQSEDLLEIEDNDLDLNSIQKNKIEGNTFPHINLEEVAKFIPYIEIPKKDKKADSKNKLKNKECLKKNENENSENAMSSSTNRSKRNSSDSTAPIVKKLKEQSKNHEKFSSVKGHKKPSEKEENKVANIFKKASRKDLKYEKSDSKDEKQNQTESASEQSKEKSTKNIPNLQESKRLIPKDKKDLTESDSGKKGKNAKKGKKVEPATEKSLQSFDSKILEVSSFDRKLIEEKRMISSKDLYSKDDQATVARSLPGEKPKTSKSNKKSNDTESEQSSENSEKSSKRKNKNKKDSGKSKNKDVKDKKSKASSKKETKEIEAKKESIPETQNNDSKTPEVSLDQSKEMQSTFKKNIELLNNHLTSSSTETQNQIPSDSYLTVTNQNVEVVPMQTNFIHRKPRKGGRRLPTIPKL